jgi:8-oxo-dGTP diphosphatase
LVQSGLRFRPLEAKTRVQIPEGAFFFLRGKDFIYAFSFLSAMDKEPKVGVGVIILKDGKVLLGKRKGSHGAGSWSFPGGHVEFNESLEDTSKREVLEETGIQIENLRKGPYTNDMFKEEDKHYITLFIIADYAGGELELKEPEKCDKWDWFNWNEFPAPLFLPVQNLLKLDFNPLKN